MATQRSCGAETSPPLLGGTGARDRRLYSRRSLPGRRASDLLEPLTGFHAALDAVIAKVVTELERVITQERLDVTLGIWTQRAIHELADEEVEVAAENRTDVAFLLLDADGVKHINAACQNYTDGDKVVREFVRRVRDVLGP
jgi:GGDEF domain-containing protein